MRPYGDAVNSQGANMSDVAQGMSQGQEGASVSATESTPSPVPSETRSDERTFRQQEVNDIVGRAKHEAVERYKRAQETQTRDTSSIPEDKYRQLAQEEAKRYIEDIRKDALQQSQNEAAQRTVNNFYSKTTQPGKEKYQDFDKVTGDIELQRFPNIVQLMAEYVDNPHDVFYELGKDRIKMANLEQLAHLSPNDAIKAAKDLAQSLKDNEQASKTRLPNEPLSQLRPSTIATDTGAMTVSDYRKKYRV